MHEFVALKMNRDEYHLLVRLIGHHTSGDGGGKLSALYERLCDLRPIEAAIATNKGPLATSIPQACKDIYGDRPMVNIDA